VTVASGCTALAFVTPTSTATATSAPTQLRRALPAASQSGIPVPRPVRIVAAAPRAHSGAWELVAPPAPPDAANSPDGGYSFNYYGGTLLHVSHARWAGLTVGLTARPSSCGTQVLHVQPCDWPTTSGLAIRWTQRVCIGHLQPALTRSARRSCSS
jgi:hypothetical protein